MMETKSTETQSEETHEHHIPRGKVTVIVLLLAAIVVAAWLAGYLPRRDRAIAAVAAADEVRSEVPFVTTTQVRKGAADVEIVLPGSLVALSEASIYARAT